MAARSTRDLTESVTQMDGGVLPVTFVNRPGTAVADPDVIGFPHLLADDSARLVAVSRRGVV